MDGTECGNGRWCVNGYCEPMSKRRTSKDGLRHNPRPGGKINFLFFLFVKPMVVEFKDMLSMA